MTLPPYAFIEFFVVAAFAVAWIVLELVCKRLDRAREQDSLQRTAEAEKQAGRPAPEQQPLTDAPKRENLA
jgi:hypothetical protein